MCISWACHTILYWNLQCAKFFICKIWKWKHVCLVQPKVIILWCDGALTFQWNTRCACTSKDLLHYPHWLCVKEFSYEVTFHPCLLFVHYVWVIHPKPVNVTLVKSMMNEHQAPLRNYIILPISQSAQALVSYDSHLRLQNLAVCVLLWISPLLVR